MIALTPAPKLTPWGSFLQSGDQNRLIGWTKIIISISYPAYQLLSYTKQIGDHTQDTVIYSPRYKVSAQLQPVPKHSKAERDKPDRQ